MSFPSGRGAVLRIVLVYAVFAGLLYLMIRGQARRVARHDEARRDSEARRYTEGLAARGLSRETTCLRKPFTMTDLSRKVREALGRRD